MKSPETSIQKSNFSSWQKLGAVAGVAAAMLGVASSSSGDVKLDESIRSANIVAMGDSFQSGAGAGDYDPNTITDDNKCYRSKNSVAGFLERDYGLKVKNVACRGMSPEDLIDQNTGQFNEPSQLEALSEDTQIVILSIGGNRFNLIELNERLEQSRGADDVVIIDALNTLRSDEFKDMLRRVYDEILQRASNADVYVEGYVKPIDARFGCPVILDRYRDQFISDFTEMLNRAIEQVVKDDKSGRLHFVKPPEGDFCSSVGQGITSGGENPGHPTAQTNRNSAKLIAQSIHADSLSNKSKHPNQTLSGEKAPDMPDLTYDYPKGGVVHEGDPGWLDSVNILYDKSNTRLANKRQPKLEEKLGLHSIGKQTEHNGEATGSANRPVR